MEHNTPIITKKIWNLIRVAFYMLRKSICKRKLLLDLNLIMKRGKNIAGKALQRNLMFFNQHQHQRRQQGFRFKPDTDGPAHHLQVFTTTPPGEYEFSCSNTPLYRHYFANKKKQHNHNSKNVECFYTPYSSFEDFDNGIEVFHDMLSSPRNDNSTASSPAGLGLGFRLNSGPVRHLRITDSPFPLQSTEDGDGGHVDAAAQDFINKFYSQLKKQNYY